MTDSKSQTTDPAIEARQRANECNQDNEPFAWGVPCCDGCVCKLEALAERALLDELRLHYIALP